ncbi:MAG: VanZ family protein [Bacteroidota bacterium]
MVILFNDKLMHLGVFMAFSSIFLIAGHREGFLWLTNTNLVKVALVVAALTAIGTESLQYFIHGRSTSFYDLIANTLGVLCGYLCYKGWIRLFGG